MRPRSRWVESTAWSAVLMTAEGLVFSVFLYCEFPPITRLEITGVIPAWNVTPLTVALVFLCMSIFIFLNSTYVFMIDEARSCFRVQSSETGTSLNGGKADGGRLTRLSVVSTAPWVDLLTVQRPPASTGWRREDMKQLTFTHGPPSRRRVLSKTVCTQTHATKFHDWPYGFSTLVMFLE